MMVNLGTVVMSVIAIAASLCAIYFGFKSTKREDKFDIERRATQQANITSKLDEIGGNVKEIKEDVKGVKTDVTGLNDRLIKIEIRVDNIEEKRGRKNTSKKRVDEYDRQQEVETN